MPALCRHFLSTFVAYSAFWWHHILDSQKMKNEWTITTLFVISEYLQVIRNIFDNIQGIISLAFLRHFTGIKMPWHSCGSIRAPGCFGITKASKCRNNANVVVCSNTFMWNLLKLKFCNKTLLRTYLNCLWCWLNVHCCVTCLCVTSVLIRHINKINKKINLRLIIIIIL